MHVLFIGGTGLISTAIARQLVEQGHQVTLFNRGKSENRLPDDAAVEILTGDRKDYPAFEAQFADKQYDVVVDMVAFHPDDAASAVRAFAGRCGQFIHCSTVCVYSGPVKTIPTPETEPYHSIGSYGKNKIAIEELLLQAHADQRFPATILRPSHSYGEGGSITRPWGGAGAFVDRLRKNKPVVVPGDGTGVWASCHVDDVAKGFIGVMGKELCLGEAYNITGEEYLTWNDYHQTLADVSGGTITPVYIPTDTLVTVAPELSRGAKEIFAWPSIFVVDKIKRDAGYPGQTISWRDGAARTVAWMDANGKIADSDADDYEDRLIASWQNGIGALPRQA
ncbi:MAG: NAD-dependent epimerase/dehydratase family protein [Cytophagales bacterium]|nr:NAD-dependent epimerase/dehydratase family protein [Armatimonadota bacterium]